MLRAGWKSGLLIGAWLIVSSRAPALEPPPDLPRYDLAVRIDPQNRLVRLNERVTWTNRSKVPANELVFNVYPRFQLTEDELPVVAKTIELLRESPGAVLDLEGRCGDVERVGTKDASWLGADLDNFSWRLSRPIDAEDGVRTPVEYDERPICRLPAHSELGESAGDVSGKPAD